jgi:hypothetical protein
MVMGVVVASVAMARVTVRIVVMTVRHLGLGGIRHDAETKTMNGLGAMRTGLMNHCGVANATPGVSRGVSELDCFVASLLAMTSPNRHCERSEAIQRESR